MYRVWTKKRESNKPLNNNKQEESISLDGKTDVATNTVSKKIARFWKLVIYDLVYAMNIQPTRGYIRGKQCLYMPTPKCAKYLFTRSLALVSM